MSKKQPLVPVRSKFQVRRDELQRQEMLLLEKKRQIEAKLCNRDSAESCSTTSGTGVPEASQSASLPPNPPPHVPASYTVVNKFQNNGSFLEMFRAMQSKEGIEKDQHHDDG
jgi:hypothetical protein